MRKLVSLTCATVLGALIVSGAQGASSDAGVLSVDHGKGLLMLDLRGSTLGRLASGTLTIIDKTPRDPFTANVVGKKMTQVVRLGPKTTRYRGQALRFRMLGGRYRMVIHGSGISVSAVGWGTVQLLAERIQPGDDAGVYSVDGTDCTVDPVSCTPLPDIMLRLTLGTTP